VKNAVWYIAWKVGGGCEFVWAGQGMPGSNVPGQRQRGAYVESVMVMVTRDI